MARVILFDTQTHYFKPPLIYGVHESEYQGRPDAIIYSTDPAMLAIEQLVNSVQHIYLREDNGVLREMTTQEKAAVDAAIALQSLLNRRSLGIGLLSTPEGEGIILRALADVIKDEFNILRQWEMSFKAAVAASTNLANFQARVAALPDLPDRTLVQLRNAIESRISSGGVDS